MTYNKARALKAKSAQKYVLSKMGIFGPQGFEGTGGVAAPIALTGPLANLPANGAPGTLYIPNNSVYDFLVDDGSNWEYFIGGQLMTLPVDTDFNWVNQGGASVTVAGAIYFTTPQNSTTNFRLRTKTAPGTPWTITVAFLPNHSVSDFQGSGIGMRESSTGKLWIFSYSQDGTGNGGLSVDRETNETTFLSGARKTSWQICKNCLWLRMADDGIDVIFSASNNGVNYEEIYREIRTTFMAGGADQVHLNLNSQHTLYGVKMTIVSWLEA